MKTILLILLLIFSFNTQGQTTKQKGLIASCCETEVGKCTGSAYCSTCKNCSRCKHCSNGGSCGVCAGTIINTFTSSTKKSTSKSTTSHTKTIQVETNYYAGKSLIVINTTLNLRREPKTTSEIIQTLSKNDFLTFIEKKGDWIKVIVNENQETGWVYSKHVK
ncbi:SH3 domain-containing protein [Flavobacterium sp.]|uniref:SH3 domain-containing protein n=1 Tax=Flavobacterium sp. TaxID=239 RepID=UPI004047AA79